MLASVCVCSVGLAAYLSMMGVVLHSEDLCGIANGNNPGPNCVVETRQGWVDLLASNMATHSYKPFAHLLTQGLPSQNSWYT